MSNVARIVKLPAEDHSEAMRMIREHLAEIALGVLYTTCRSYATGFHKFVLCHQNALLVGF